MNMQQMTQEDWDVVIATEDDASAKFGLMLQAMMDDSLPLVSKAYFDENESRSHILFWDGFEAYIEGQPLENMPTKMQERGWWFGNKMEGEAEFENDCDYTLPSIQ